MFPSGSCLWTSEPETLNARPNGVTYRFRTLRSLAPSPACSLRHAKGSLRGVLVASQDGGPRGEGCGRAADPGAEPAERCPAASGANPGRWSRCGPKSKHPQIDREYYHWQS